MSFRNEIKTTTCRRCGVGKVMTGRHADFNAKSSDGTVICLDCKVAEIIKP